MRSPGRSTFFAVLVAFSGLALSCGDDATTHEVDADADDVPAPDAHDAIIFPDVEVDTSAPDGTDSMNDPGMMRQRSSTLSFASVSCAPSTTCGRSKTMPCNKGCLPRIPPTR